MAEFDAPVLHTERLVIRGWREEDAAPLARLNGDPEVMEHMAGRLGAAESAAFMGRIQAHFREHGFGFWAVEAPGVAPFIGCVGLLRSGFDAHFTPCVEVGWRLDRPRRGRGYATEAARAALTFGFRELLLPEIVSFTTVKNLRSQSVMPRLGMRRDPADDFLHPALAPDHPIRPHVLYRLGRAEFEAATAER
ncbi:ribosomal-protein-alanine N-acetyltransferase [Faunimonas pinastri]|uniref:Ribosomal-protein-alanine N-acetyltransferase n=1 Tax=Faunimonas pinastri TaxID=1855383 RepID=A0A1H9KVC8_9HYPH|nr:GNAT family N-acetyltransferase [Faunimonas pinastri]SER02989.1 ribosomal-protein-alanine N-acetyltransferase [Faunimonas pinastri]